MLPLLLIALSAVSVASLEQLCSDEAICEGVSSEEASHSRALLQTKSAPARAPATTILQTKVVTGLSCGAEQMDAKTMVAHLKASRSCLPADLQRIQLQRHASLLVTVQFPDGGSQFPDGGTNLLGELSPVALSTSLTETEGHEACMGDAAQPGDHCTLFGHQGACSISPRMKLACNIGQYSACSVHSGSQSIAGVACEAAGLQGTCQVGGVTPAPGSPSYLTCELAPTSLVVTDATTQTAAAAQAAFEPTTGSQLSILHIVRPR